MGAPILSIKKIRIWIDETDLQDELRPSGAAGYFLLKK